MNILVDTHIIIWWLVYPDKIKKTFFDYLIDEKNSVYVSAVSLWEISLKQSIGKLKLSGVEPKDLINLIEESGFELIDLSAKEAVSFDKIPKYKNKDPFDRMLVWQSIYNNYYFMSSDSKVKEYEKDGLKLL